MAQFAGVEYRHIDPQQIIPSLSEDPRWYLEGVMPKLKEELIDNPQTETDPVLKAKKREFVNFLAFCLDQKLVALGNQPEGFNDDDRWGSVFAIDPEIKAKQPDTVVIHHTHTSGVSFSYFNALGLLRQYVPVYLGIDSWRGQPISSGHFFRGRQTFVSYHRFIWPNGRVTHALKEDYMGLQAGDLETNRRSVGIAFVGSFMEKSPTPQALKSGQMLIDKLGIPKVIGHREVYSKKYQTLVDTACPGNTYYGSGGWGKMLNLR